MPRLYDKSSRSPRALPTLERPPERPPGPESLAQWLQSLGPAVHSLRDGCGAVLVRGFEIDDEASFARCLAALGVAPISYRGGNTPRTRRGPGIYTATEYAASQTISLHNELSYSASWPEHLYFCCARPADEGGATTLADGRRVLAGLDSAVVEAFRERGVRYVRNLHGGRGLGRSWQATFETDDREQVERACAASGTQFRWTEAGGLRVEHVGPGVIEHPRTGEAVWFNQAEQFHPSSLPAEVAELLLEDYRGREQQLPQWASFADGEPLSPPTLDAVRAQLRREIIEVPWRRGDLLLVDNILALHGRASYSGEREILVAMA